MPIVAISMSSAWNNLTVLAIAFLATSFLPLQCQFRSVLVSKYLCAYYVSHTSPRWPFLIPLVRIHLRQLSLTY